MIAALLLTAGLALADDPSPPITSLPLPELHPKRPPAERFGTAAFRTSIPAAGPAVTTRLAFVQDLDGTSIGELTLAGQMGWHVFGLAVETAATAGASPRWSSAGFGNTVIDARVLFGRGSTHAIGVRGTLATGNRGGANGPVAWWGTVPAATVPTWGLALAYEGATARWVWHAHIGFHTNRWAYSYTSDVWDAGASLATIQPLAERWDLVGEVEVLSAWSPVHLRALARLDLGHGWTVDGGLALPAAVFFQDPTLQVLGRVDRRW